MPRTCSDMSDESVSSQILRKTEDADWETESAEDTVDHIHKAYDMNTYSREEERDCIIAARDKYVRMQAVLD